MALQRKSVTLVEEYTYICRQDDAVQQDAPDFDLKWQQYLDGQGPPPLIPGAKPTVFKLRHLNTLARGRLMRYLARANEDRSLFWDAAFAAFNLAVVGVEGLLDAEGKPVKLQFDFDDEGPHKVPVLHADSVEQFDISWVYEVGDRVIKRLNPDPK